MLRVNVEAQPPRWSEVAERLRPFVRGRVQSESDADDVLQDVLLRIHTGIGGVRERERLSAWMYQVARSSLADFGRARARHPLTRQEEVHEQAAESPTDPAEELVVERLASTLSVFVARLPSPYREALTLTELEGRTQREAAEIMGISLSGMKSRVQRGRRQLRELVEACCRVELDARGHVVACEPRLRTGAPPDCCR